MSKGIAAQKAGQLAAARKHYEQAMRLQPRKAGARTNLAVLAMGRGANDDARFLLDAEVGAHPDLVEAHLAHAIVLARLSKPDEATAAAQRVADDAEASGTVRARALLVLAVLAARSVPPAPDTDVHALLDRARKQSADDPDVVRVAASLTAELAERPRRAAYAAVSARAASAYAEVSALTATGPPARRASTLRIRAILSSQRGDWKAALADLERSRELVPLDQDGQLDRVVALARVGDLDGARAALREALEGPGAETPRAAELRQALLNEPTPK